MTLRVSLHNIKTARASTFTSGDADFGCVSFASADGEIDLFLPPEVARAIADAFNATQADKMPVLEAAE